MSTPDPKRGLLGRMFHRDPKIGSKENPVQGQPVYAKPVVPYWLADFVFSPVVRDTIASLLGGRPTARWEPNDASRAAAYVSWADPFNVTYTTPFPGKVNKGGTIFRDLDQIAFHEFGHSFDFSTDRRDYDYLERIRLLDNIENIFWSLPTSKASRWMDNEGNLQSREYFADAFSEAINIVRWTQQPDMTDKDILRMIADAEDAIPGTTRIVKYLLAQPIYEKHPKKGIFGSKEEP